MTKKPAVATPEQWKEGGGGGRGGDRKVVMHLANSSQGLEKRQSSHSVESSLFLHLGNSSCSDLMWDFGFICLTIFIITLDPGRSVPYSLFVVKPNSTYV